MSENLLQPEDVERFLKRERDEYEPRGECWNTVDDVLDCFRLHMVTGTPLTSPRPHEGPEPFGAGLEPLTEAEELRAEVERLNRLAKVQSDMISEITAACMATEKERDQFRKQAELLGAHLQGGSQTFIDALADASRLRAELDSIRARGLARSDQLLAALDRCSYDDRVRRRAYEQSAQELRSLIDGAVGE